MADVAATAVTIIRSWTRGGTNGKRQRVMMADIAGTFTAGGTTNRIPATIFPGFKVIEECIGMGVLDDNSRVHLLVPSYDGSLLLAVDMDQATDANRNIPADITVTSPRKIRVVVAGY